MTLDFPVGNYHRGDLSINTLLSSTEYLVANAHSEEINLNLAKAQSMRWLALDGLMNTRNLTSSAPTFPLLESLSLTNLRKLEEVWDAPIPTNSFYNLKHLTLVWLPELRQLGKLPHGSSVSYFRNLSTLDVSNCSGLGNLFASAAAATTKDCVLQLKRISLHFCEEMEHVIVLPEGAGSDVMIFPKLRSLHLTYLHKLVSICRGTRSIGFPMLAEMAISCCENMRCLVSSSDGDNSSEEHYRDRDSLHLFCQPKASFPNLQKLSLRSNVESKNAWCNQVPIGFFTGLVELYISKYNKIRTLFSSTSSSKIPQNLVNLQKLYIEDCEEMLRVIGDEEEVSSSSSSSLSLCDDHTTKHTTHLFPSLQNLTLSRMPELESFCEWRCALELPSLKMFWIADCCEMKSFNAAAGSLVVTPALQIVTIDGEDLEFADDLNATLYQHFEKAN